MDDSLSRTNFVGTLCIGPLRVACHVDAGVPPLEPVGAYAHFYQPGVRCAVSKSDVHMDVILRTGNTSRPQRSPEFEAGRHWCFHQTGAHCLFATGYFGRVRPERLLRATPDLATAEITIDISGHPTRSGFPLSYPLDQILAWGMLARARGFLLHAALVVDPDGNGLLFAGRSGAGKSTMSALCAEAGWTILNDDRALLYVEGNRIMAAGTPWHGSGRYAERRTVPVDGICFLAKAAEHRVETLDRDAAKAEWLQVAAVPWFLDAWANPTLDTLDHIMCKLPANRLHFAPDPTVVGVIPRRIHRGL